MKNNSIYELTLNHTGKMAGLSSVSTSPTKNPICQARQCVKGSICQNCFAAATEKRYSNLGVKLARNYDKLTTRVFAESEIPVINTLMFRIEAFGDLVNDIQALNYLNLVKKNSAVNIAWWTKNPQFIKGALKRLNIHSKADFKAAYPNLTIVYSSMYMNEKSAIPGGCEWFIEKRFTVYSLDFLLNHSEIQINCGAASCRGCGLCYLKNNNVFDICELLKADTKKAKKEGVNVND